MKTTKIIFALSLALIFATGINTLYAQGGIQTKTTRENKAAKVNYLVRVANINLAHYPNAQFLIMLTDETGLEVAPSQTYRPGVTDYTFTEGGTVRGTRVARMVATGPASGAVSIRPVSKTGVFYGGATYLFMIIPLPSARNSGFAGDAR